jgi:aspartate/methionine/tyrosine aminotransferase
MKISKRINDLEESATLAASQKARDLKAQGVDVISLTVGESDFNTPQYVVDAATETLEKGLGTHYTPTNGIPELRQAIVDFHKRTDHLEYGLDEVFVGSGAKNVLYNLFQVIVDPGDEVIIPAPYWVSFSEHVKLAGGNSVIVKGASKDEYKITVEDLEEAYTDKTVALLINSPSNPSGAVYSKEELTKIGEWAVEKGIILIADEIYNRLVYNGKEPFSIASLSDAIKKQTIVVNGVSKTYAMTGWRIGYAVGDKEIIAGVTKFASQATGNPAGVSQYAAMAAYNDETDEVEKMKASFQNRLNKAYEGLMTVPGFHLPKKPDGAFYLFPDVTEAAEMTGYQSVDDFSLALIEEAHVVAVAGSSFGIPECLRFSYAVDEADFAEAVERIKKFIEENKK